ncbi:amidohydrolase family protein [Undibacterium arcticum]
MKALGGGIAIQHRMAFQGEYFVERYGAEAAQHTPPVGRMLAAGVPVGAGTDATRVASYNPWTALYWMVSGRTVGGLRMYDSSNRLSRDTALELWSAGSAWFSSEHGKKRGASKKACWQTYVPCQMTFCHRRGKHQVD